MPMEELPSYTGKKVNSSTYHLGQTHRPSALSESDEGENGTFFARGTKQPWDHLVKSVPLVHFFILTLLCPIPSHQESNRLRRILDSLDGASPKANGLLTTWLYGIANKRRLPSASLPPLLLMQVWCPAGAPGTWGDVLQSSFYYSS